VGDGFPHEPGGFCHSVAILGFALNQVNETTEQDVELSRRKIYAFAMSFSGTWEQTRNCDAPCVVTLGFFAPGRIFGPMQFRV